MPIGVVLPVDTAGSRRTATRLTPGAISLSSELPSACRITCDDRV